MRKEREPQHKKERVTCHAICHIIYANAMPCHKSEKLDKKAYKL
jgi:hypothetical protein